MAYRSLVDAFCYGGGYNIGAYLTTLGYKCTSDVASWRPLGSTAPTIALTGTKAGELTLAGPYDDAVIAPMMTAAMGTDKVICAGFESDAVSQRAWCFRAAQVAEYEMQLASDNINQFVPGIAINGVVNNGYIVAPLTARTTAGNTQSTYADMGASSTSARAFLVITSISLGGYDSVTVTTQSSADHSAWSDETAFTTATAIGGESVALAATTERYLAIKWAYVGSGTSPTWTGFVAVSRD